jgi:putative intracellular protease/amidase
MSGRKKVVVLASNYGVWAEELQAPWDALKKAGHEVTLATRFGLKPLPIAVSMDSAFMDPVRNVSINPPDVVRRVAELLDGPEWASPITFTDIDMSRYDAIVLVGGPGSALDMVGNPNIHRILLQAYRSTKLIAALCYTVGCLAFTRDPANGNRSIIYGRTVVAHPAAWDLVDDIGYSLYGATPDNRGTDIVTAGFVFPLQHMTEDAVGPNGRVIAEGGATREDPCVAVDLPFVTGLSVESSIGFGEKLVEALAFSGDRAAAQASTPGRS